MKRVIFLMVAFLVLGLAASAQAALVLPDPEDEIDGIALASHYGDFYTFPTTLMIDLITKNPAAALSVGAGTADDWKVVSGVGQLDVLAYTFPTGTDNDPVSWGSAFPEPIYPSELTPDVDGAIHGTWGEPNPTGDDPDGLTVGQLIDYIDHFNPGSSTPVFGFDMSESQGNGLGFLNVWGQVRIVDEDDGALLESWVLGDQGEGDWIYAPEALTLGGPEGATSDASISGNYYYIDNGNTGGGRLDYVVFSPDIVLRDFSNWDRDDLFLVDLHFKDLKIQGEDVFLTTMYYVPGKEIVPEPASLSLLGLGLLGLLKRKRI